MWKLFRNNSAVSSLYNLFLKYATYNTKSFIFCATTGRSGTETLSRIISTAKNVKAFHEPYPKMKNDTKNRYGIDLKEVFLNIKRIEIRKASIGYEHYFEANHLFITNYAEYVMNEFGEKVKVVHLRRDPVAVSRSFFAIDSIPGKTESGRKWMPEPHDPHNILQIGPLWKNLDHPFYKCLWFWYEIEARISLFKKQYPFVRMFFIKTEDLNDLDKLKNMFLFFGFEYEEDDLYKSIGRQYNVKSSRKKHVIDESEALRLHEKFVSVLDKYFPNILSDINC